MISGVLGAASGVCRSLEECDTGLPMAAGWSRSSTIDSGGQSKMIPIDCHALSESDNIGA